MAIENAINYSLRVIKPVIDGKGSAVEVKFDAEARYSEQMQKDLKNTVFGSGGCRSWYVNENASGEPVWNKNSYPYSQSHYWYRCLFPVWKDWTLIVSVL